MMRTVLLVDQVLIMLLPGAKISTTEPKLEELVIRSKISMEPTVVTEGTRAGEVEPASVALFPAATVT